MKINGKHLPLCIWWCERALDKRYDRLLHIAMKSTNPLPYPVNFYKQHRIVADDQTVIHTRMHRYIATAPAYCEYQFGVGADYRDLLPLHTRQIPADKMLPGFQDLATRVFGAALDDAFYEPAAESFIAQVGDSIITVYAIALLTNHDVTVMDFLRWKWQGDSAYAPALIDIDEPFTHDVGGI